jgi:hypothetical protein
MQEEQTETQAQPIEAKTPEAQAAEAAEAPALTEMTGGPQRRKRTKIIALSVLGICCCFMMVGIGLLSLGALILWGILSLVLAALLLLLGIYLNAASRLVMYTDGSSRWEWELKK